MMKETLFSSLAITLSLFTFNLNYRKSFKINKLLRSKKVKYLKKLV